MAARGPVSYCGCHYRLRKPTDDEGPHQLHPTLPSPPVVSDPEPGVDSKIIAVVVVCSVLGIVLLLLLFVLLVWKMSRQRSGKQSYAPSEKSRDSFRR